jgi:pyrroline-5-carboxylate reductase
VKATVFLGGGRITSALVAGLRLAGYSRPIVCYDRHLSKLKTLKREYSVIAEPNLRAAVASAQLLIIAVRPDSLRLLLQEIKGFAIDPRIVAISLAAGFPLAKLQTALGPPTRWARAMPSPVCRTGQGLTALAFAGGLSVASRNQIRKFFALVGRVLEIPEKEFDAFTVAFSSSHGYHALASLIVAARAVGLDRQTATIAATHALADGIAAWREGNLPLEKLLQEAATPGGTAAAVMTSLDAAGFQKIIENGLRTGILQARRNAAK